MANGSSTVQRRRRARPDQWPTQPLRFDEDGVPTLAAHEMPDRYCWAVWCCWCDDWHAHSAGGGHRAAHCIFSTPYSTTGYFLERFDPGQDA